MKHTDTIRETLNNCWGYVEARYRLLLTGMIEPAASEAKADLDRIDTAIAILRAMEGQEPVAWMVKTTNARNGETSYSFALYSDSARHIAKERFGFNPNWKHSDPIPLYTHPAPSDAVEEVMEVVKNHHFRDQHPAESADTYLDEMYDDLRDRLTAKLNQTNG